MHPSYVLQHPLFFTAHGMTCRAVMCRAAQSDLMSAGARLGMPSTEEAALLSSVLHAHR